MLEKYLAIRQLYPQWFRSLDIAVKALKQIIDSVFMVPLVERDEYGRQLISTCTGFDPYRFTSTQMARAILILVEELLVDDEESHVATYSNIHNEQLNEMIEAFKSRLRQKCETVLALGDAYKSKSQTIQQILERMLI